MTSLHSWFISLIPERLTELSEVAQTENNRLFDCPELKVWHLLSELSKGMDGAFLNAGLYLVCMRETLE